MQLSVWKIEYDSGFNSKSGIRVPQTVTEWLIATDLALLKYKVCRNKGSDRVRVFTDVQMQGRLLDVGSIKRHEFFRRMHKAAGGSPLREPQQQPIRDIAHLLAQDGLEQLIASDEKAQTAMMTAMGHNGTLGLPEEAIERAKANLAVREVEVKQKVLAKAGADELWGIF